jgi:CIC family chloride channel protein
VQQAFAELRATAFHTGLVTDHGELIGIVTLEQLENTIAESAVNSAEDISPIGAVSSIKALLTGFAFPHIHADQGIDLALERMGENHLDLLPVVSRADVHQIEGIVTLQDVLDAFGVPQTESSAS